MDKTIRQLYNGELFPREKAYPKEQDYLGMRDEMDILQNSLFDMLDKDGKELLDDILCLKTRMCGYTDVDDFIEGFRLGAKLIIEVLCQSKDDEKLFNDYSSGLLEFNE